MIRTLIVDDEPPSRRRVRDLLAEDPEFTLVGECGDGAEAVALLREEPCDLVFLDVQMPELNGLEAARLLAQGDGPAVIFVTAYDCYALPAFEVHAVDYLLKPFDRDRFQKALAWAKTAVRRDRGEAPAAPAEPPRDRKPVDRLTIKTTGRIYFVNASEIDWVEAAGNYLRLHSGPKTHMLRETMNNLEARLDPARFWRIHRSTIVNVERIRELQPLFHGDYVAILRDGKELTLSRTYRRSLPGLFGEGI
ncbi:MAG TPA: LytTR family DNA-binding domain-containing protein [Gemmataceae bacterium]|nr:LytTR family DNA-binding domain-containing protein [Gemmataceae bacterium]